MGDIVEMKRKIEASVYRFGRVFKVEMHAGPNPKSCDPQAALSIDGAFLCWCAVEFHEDDWSEIHLDLSDQHRLLEPADLGISEASEERIDYRFLAEAEEYIMVLLNDDLARKLVSTATEPGEEPEEAEEEILSPSDRGDRLVRVWHNHGKRAEQLPELVSIEICDALHAMGEALGDLLDENIEVEREHCGDFVRETVSDALLTWRHESELG